MTPNIKPGPGSSPPARGTPILRRAVMANQRFIPACAGNTQARKATLEVDPVHPRLRGEHFGCVRNITSRIGSSPPARGTLPFSAIERICRRFIPACAGNTGRAKAEMDWFPVHPRLRGEHRPRTQRAAVSIGSSPPARGTLRLCVRCTGRRRFIPACAGNTEVHGGVSVMVAVHPRLRGEHRSGFCISGSITGSSPPARGTRSMAADCRRP